MGSTTVEQKKRFRSYDPDVDGFNEDLSDSRPASYKFGRSARNDYGLDQSVPLFLSDPDGEPDPREFIAPLRRGRMASVTSKILMAVVAASGVAIAFAWFSSDSTRDIIINAKASIAAAASPPSAVAQADASQLTASDIQLKGGAGAPAAAAAPAPAPSPIMVANAAPSREEISSAYQSALRSAVPAAVAPPATAPVTPSVTPPILAAPQPSPSPSPTRQMDSQELATLMKRAKDMLAAGDIPSARLFLERAAEAQDANAALMLARTYDPDVLGTSDVRNITPEPAKARAWYEKAAQFGSSEAQRRLAQLPN